MQIHPMKKLIFACSLLFTFFGFAQAQQSPAVQKAIKDPNRKANEAKADKMVSDSSKKQVQANPVYQKNFSNKKKCNNCSSNSKKKSS